MRNVKITGGAHKGKVGRVVGLYATTPHSDVLLDSGRTIKVADRHLALVQAAQSRHGKRTKGGTAR